MFAGNRRLRKLIGLDAATGGFTRGLQLKPVRSSQKSCLSTPFPVRHIDLPRFYELP